VALPKIRSIQVLRGVAATAVVVHHFYAPNNAASPARLGAAGVDLFFVISGFIMATIADGRSPVDFLRDRAWRIYPLWLLSSLPLALFVGSDAYQLLTTATLWPVWDTYRLPLNSVGWSLSFEMLFYCLFAVGLATRWIVPFVLLAVFIALGAILGDNPLLRFLGNPLGLEFLAGVTIARLPLDQRLGSFVVAIGAALFTIAPHVDPNVLNGPAMFSRVAGWGIPAALVVYGARSLECHFAGRCWQLPLLLGDASYSIYLFHRRLLAFNLPWLSGALMAVAVGILIHVAVERPLRRRNLSLRRVPATL
jgi:exopolysaccharide production protein ExoZ